MTTIKVHDTEYDIPTSWYDVTVKQEIEIEQLKDRDEQFRYLHRTSVYTGIPIPILKKMNINQINAVNSLMKFLFTPIPKEETITTFEFKGHTYYLMDSIIAGETQDFLSNEGVIKHFKDNPEKALPYIIAVVAKRKGESLENYDVWKRGEEFLELPYPIAKSIWFFFAHIGTLLSIDTQRFLLLQDKVLEAQLNYSESTLKGLDGLPLYKRLLRTILLSYSRSLNKSWKTFLTSTQSEFSKQN